MTQSRPARTLFEWCSHSANVLLGANCFNTTTFLLNSWAGLFKVDYPRLYGMSWWHFTVSINPEFLEKFTLGGNVAIVVLIKMILRRKHAVHQSTTPFQTDRYSRSRQLAASFPFTAHAKNRKSRCQIARFAGGPCIWRPPLSSGTWGRAMKQLLLIQGGALLKTWP